MTALVNQLDEKRKLADEMHAKFLESRKEADKCHEEALKRKRDIRDLEKVIKTLKSRQYKTKEQLEREELIRKAKEIYEMFKRGEKIDTEDLLILQKAGLI
jgi:Uncharacterized archaeal coiled-coil protein